MKVIAPTYEFPDRIDGINSVNEGIKEAAFIPEGVLIHEYYPLEWVFIKEIGNDLTYIGSHWDLDRYWKNYIKDRLIYERLRNKYLLGQQVVVDYTTYPNLGIYIPINKYVSGIGELYKTMLDECRSLDKEALDRIIKEQGYAKIEDTIAHYKERVD
jgi:hypothetical protein